MTQTHGNFLAEGFRELGRKMDRRKLRGAMRTHDAERATALTALGQRAWDEKLDLSAFAELSGKLSQLDARAGELSAAASKLGSEKENLDTERRTELEKFAARRKAIEDRKSPIDNALRVARSAKTASEQTIRQSESQLAAIAGKLSAFDRVIASLGSAADPGQAEKLAATKADRSKLVTEQGELNIKLAKAREELPAQAAEDSRLDGESRALAAEIAAVDAEQKAAISHIDENLARVRKDIQGTSQQASTVQKDRAGNFGVLGQALYDARIGAPQLAPLMERVAGIDRARAQSQSSLEVSLADTRALPGATMAKFWGVTLGMPLLVAGLSVAGYKYLHRSTSGAVAPPPPVAQAKARTCEVQKPPENGTGVGVRADCIRTEGTFVNSRLASGKITYADGRVREGEFVGGRQMGMGKFTWPDGRRHEGIFADGRTMGPGEYVSADGTKDKGLFKPDSKLHGIGVRELPGGGALVGEFDHGKPSKKMALVKNGKTEVVEFTDAGVPAKGTARVETSNQ